MRAKAGLTMGIGRSSRNEGEETNLCYLANDGMAIYSPAVGESWEWQQEEQGSWCVKLEAHPSSEAEKAGDWVGNTAFDLFNSQRKRHVRSRQARNCDNAVIVPDFKLLSHHLCVAVPIEMLSHLSVTMIEYQVWSWRNEHHLYFQRKEKKWRWCDLFGYLSAIFLIRERKSLPSMIGQWDEKNRQYIYLNDKQLSKKKNVSFLCYKILTSNMECKFKSHFMGLFAISWQWSFAIVSL